MAEETTTSKKPSNAQIVETIRNARKDLDAISELILTLKNVHGWGDIVTGALFNSEQRVIEARMWLGRALAELGENASENNDKATDERVIVAPSRAKGDIAKEDEGGGRE